MRYASAATPTLRFGSDTTREMLLIELEHTKENRLINRHNFISLELFYVLSFLWQLKREFNFYDGAKIGHLSKWTRYPPA